MRRSASGSGAVAGCRGWPRRRPSRRSEARSSWRGSRHSWASARATSSAFPRSPTRRMTSVPGSRGASSVVAQSLTRLGPLTRATTPKLLWLNSPSNPSGQVLGVEHLAKVVAWAREHGVVVASDECYAELDWRPGQLGRATPSVLHPDVCGGDHSGLLAVYSLEAVQFGRLPRGLRRRRCGAHRADPRGPQARRMMMPAPVQHAMAVALGDDAHVAEQRDLWPAEVLLEAVQRAGLRIDHSEAALPLGHPRGGLLGNGFRAGRSRHPRRSGQLLRSCRAPARPHRPDGDRRADQGGEQPPLSGGLHTRRGGGGADCTLDEVPARGGADCSSSGSEPSGRQNPPYLPRTPRCGPVYRHPTPLG